MLEFPGVNKRVQTYCSTSLDFFMVSIMPNQKHIHHMSLGLFQSTISLEKIISILIKFTEFEIQPEQDHFDPSHCDDTSM